MNKEERKSFEKEQSDRLETDYKWIGEKGDEDLAFAKMTVIVFVVITVLIVLAIIT